MGILIRVKDASFESKSIGFAPAVTRGLAYWNYFGNSEDRLLRNLAPNGAKSGKVGDPVLSDAYARLSKTGYITTQAKQSADQTMIAIFRPTSEATANIISNNATTRVPPLTGPTFGASLWCTVGTIGDNAVHAFYNQNVFNGLSGHNGQTTCAAGSAALALNQWHPVAGRFNSATATASIKHLQTNEIVSKAAVAPDNIPDVGVLPFGIGHGYSDGLGTASKDVAFVAIYNAYLSDEEVNLVYEQAKLFLARRGIIL